MDSVVYIVKERNAKERYGQDTDVKMGFAASDRALRLRREDGRIGKEDMLDGMEAAGMRMRRWKERADERWWREIRGGKDGDKEWEFGDGREGYEDDNGSSESEG